MAKLLTDETALQLTEALLKNDKHIKDTLESNMHSHDNKSALDNITSNKISEWDNKAEKSDIPDTKGFVTEYYVATMIAKAQLSGGEVDLSGYYSKDETYSKSEVDDKISGITGDFGGSSTLSSDIKANIAVGGIKVNDVLNAGMTLDEIVTKLCVTYLKPGVSLSISPSTVLYKNGEKVSNLLLKANVTKNSEDIQSVTFYNGSTLLKTITTNIGNGGEFTYTITEDITKNTTIKAEVKDGTSTVSATKTIQFVNPYYYGVSSVFGVNNFTGLSELLQEKANTTKAFTANNEYIVFAYDAVYSDLTDIVDQNGFSNLSDFTKSTLVVNGVTYKIYVSNTPKTISNFKYTFR